MLLNPGADVQYDGRSITYPDIKLIYWAGGNPFHHHQDLNRLVDGWRRPDTVIVNEPWWTPVAQWADIVFPATTSLERIDICASSHDPYAHFMERAIPPQHEARSDHQIFSGLAAKLGFEAAFTENKSERQWIEDMWQRSADLASTQGFQRLQSGRRQASIGCPTNLERVIGWRILGSTQRRRLWPHPQENSSCFQKRSLVSAIQIVRVKRLGSNLKSGRRWMTHSIPCTCCLLSPVGGCTVSTIKVAIAKPEKWRVRRC